jgi:ribonuclease P protein component
MLNRKYRATRVDIENTIKTGANIPGTSVYAKISRSEGKKAGFAIVVSKKTEKTSVGRHLIKRRISGFLEKNLPKIDADFKKTAVFFMKDVKSPLFYKQAEKDIKNILEKGGFFSK